MDHRLVDQGEKMSKYPIHPDFKKYEKIKIPVNRLLLPLMNRINNYSFNQRVVDEEVCQTKKIIPGYQNEPIEIILYEPKDVKGPLPCLIYFHGGAFIFKAVAFHKGLVCNYAKRTPCKVIFVNYRLAPRHPFPIGIEDCYAAFQWVIGKSKELDIDRDRIAIGGDSAGGTLAAGVCLLARDRKAPKICFQMLVYPVMDARQKTESMRRFVDTPIWNARLNKKMWMLYLKENSHLDKAYASPMEASSFLNLPKAYIEVADFDCLRDEGINFAQALKKSGIAVDLYQPKGTIHGYGIEENNEVVKSSVTNRIVALKKAFSIIGS